MFHVKFKMEKYAQKRNLEIVQHLILDQWRKSMKVQLETYSVENLTSACSSGADLWPHSLCISQEWPENKNEQNASKVTAVTVDVLEALGSKVSVWIDMEAVS